MLTIKTATRITISGNTTTDTIVVEKDKDANIIFDGLSINSGDNAAFMIADNSTGNVTIDLKGENTLKSVASCVGLQKNGSEEGIGKLTINGTGTLNATGGTYGVGIGGGNYGSGSHITINSGTVTATGGRQAAGIGGGSSGSGSHITISGGSVKASSISCTPTLADGTTKVYRYPIDTTDVTSVTIDGVDFPTKHGREKRIYYYKHRDYISRIKSI